VLYLTRPKDHRKRERQAQPKFVPKHSDRVAGVPSVAGMRTYNCRRLGVIPVRFVPSTVTRLSMFGIGFHIQHSERHFNQVRRIRFAGASAPPELPTIRSCSPSTCSLPSTIPFNRRPYPRGAKPGGIGSTNTRAPIRETRSDSAPIHPS
jgi:hypothetical protein